MAKERHMKRRLTAGLLSAAVLGTGIAALAPATASADHCGHRYGYGYYVPAYRIGWGHHRHWREEDEDGPGIGTLILGAGAAYGAYRLYDDWRARHDHHRDC